MIIEIDGIYFNPHHVVVLEETDEGCRAHLTGDAGESFAFRGWGAFALAKRINQKVREAKQQPPVQQTRRGLTRDAETGVWLSANGLSVARNVAEQAMLAAGIDPSDFRLRDKVVLAIDGTIRESLDEVSKQD